MASEYFGIFSNKTHGPRKKNEGEKSASPLYHGEVPGNPRNVPFFKATGWLKLMEIKEPQTSELFQKVTGRSLEVNHHFKIGGSFWMMINPY